jgi:hypothetical protein
MSDIKVQHREILPNGVYSPCEVAALLKCGITALYEYIREDQIKSFRIGDGKKRPHIRVKGSDLLEFIKNRTNEA